MKVWINAGELSGDLQSAMLLKALQRRCSEIESVGMGGPALAAAGMRCLLRSESLSVMGVAEVFAVIPRAFSLLRSIKKHMAAEKPDAVVVTDAPDFNFFVVRIARRLGIPVYYFIPPKVWAHRAGRIRFLKSNARRIFAILPFEERYYAEHGASAEYYGNPLVDAVDPDALDEIGPVPGRIGIMPGSRRKEVERLLPVFSEMAGLLHERHPGLEFRIFRSANFTEDYLRRFWKADVPTVFQDPEGRYAAMASCECLAAASGTATLETALAGVPTLVAYKLSPLSYRIGLKVVKVKWISLTNLILNKTAFPEYIQHEAESYRMAWRLLSWLDDPEKMAAVRADCAECRRLCGEKGSADRVAARILEDFGL
ncbi:MAG: lipid-A-disaccharide synthase [Mailhella sp.]|nr:lipid-A-disaccharide synthase [Mailhella sp.]